MSRRARRHADARPWEQQRDQGDSPDVDALLAADDQDQHLRDRAWEIHEAEQRRQPRNPT